MTKPFVKAAKAMGFKLTAGEVFLIAFLLVALVAGITFFIRWRKKKKGLVDGEGQESSSVAAVQQMSPNQLIDVWKTFLKSIPAVFRRSLLSFQHFVVLGPASSGKTQIINTYTDWERQANQFLDSEIDDPNLQIYLGSTTLVQELPPTILNDTSKGARKALLNLWRPIFRDRKPIVVVPINVATLPKNSPDMIKLLGETLRGKISMLSLIQNDSIEIRIALTHLDHLEGYEEFAKFAEKSGIPLTFRVTDNFEEELLEKITAYNDYLSAALVELPASDYKKVVRFLKELPSIAPSIAEFMEHLFAPSSFDKEPILGKIFLTSKNYLGASSNPFVCRGPDGPGQRQSPLLRHRLAATSIALIGCLYFLIGYVEESRYFSAATAATKVYTNKDATSRDTSARRTIFEFVEREEKDPVFSYFPSFFSSREPEIKTKFVDKVRANRLIPGLRKSLVLSNAHRRSLYYLAMLYATEGSSLAQLIDENIQDFEYALGLEKKLIRQYLASASEPYGLLVQLDALPGQIEETPSTSSKPWKLFFGQLQIGLDRKFITETETVSIHEQTEQLIDSLEVIQRYSSALQVLELLSQETTYDFENIYKPFKRELAFQEIFGDKIVQIEEFLRIIQSSRVNAEVSDSSMLSTLCSQLRLLNEVEQMPNALYTFELPEANYAINTNDWFTLIRDSNIRQLVLNFIARIQKNKGEGHSSEALFFESEAGFPKLIMNPTNDGSFMFTGKAEIEGNLTREAFVKQVLPVIMEFTDLLDKIEVEAEDRRILETFVYQAVDDYADAYGKAVHRYYRAFDSRARSAEGVQMIAKQMLKPLSSFEDFLNTAHAATNLPIDVEKSRFLLPMKQVLEKYESFNKVMTEMDGGFPELDKYRAILDQLVESLKVAELSAEASGAPPPAKKEAPAEGAAPELETSDELSKLLTPAGQLSLAILRRESGSYLAQVQSWLTSVNIGNELGQPFLSPIQQLYLVGLRDIEKNVAASWQHKILADLDPVLSKFPFDPTAKKEVRAEEMTEYFHPTNGRFFEYYRKYIDPISGKELNKYVKRKSYLRDLREPTNMYATINRIARLSTALWDSEGKPKPYELQVSPTPFDAMVSSKNMLTLVYISSGGSSLFNFNQKPFYRTMNVEWTKLQTSQVGIQLTNVAEGQKIYPSPLVTGDSHWSFLRLLSRAKANTANTWSWVFRKNEASEAPITVNFVIAGEPWKLFEITELTRAVAKR